MQFLGILVLRPFRCSYELSVPLGPRVALRAQQPCTLGIRWTPLEQPIWRFPEIGVPKKIIQFNGFFHVFSIENHLFWVPPLMEHPWRHGQRHASKPVSTRHTSLVPTQRCRSNGRMRRKSPSQRGCRSQMLSFLGVPKDIWFTSENVTKMDDDWWFPLV